MDTLQGYTEQLGALPPNLTASELLDHTGLRLWSDGRLCAYFTPFADPNPAGRVLLVGLTPGLQQHYIATMAAASVLRGGGSTSEALEAAGAGSFAGPLRRNLVEMLDGIGVAEWLGIDSTAQLWNGAAHLMAGTSALRHAVFRHTSAGPTNYRGTPKLWNVPQLVAMVDQHLSRDLDAAPGALVVPLGKVSAECVEYLAQAGRVDTGRVLLGMPHPSGLNGHRPAHYAASRDRMAEQVSRQPR